MAFPDPGAEGAELATAGSGAPVSSLAPEFSELSDYLGGEYVTYQGKFWQCPSGRDAGPWDPEDFVETTVGDDLTLTYDAAAQAAGTAARAQGLAYERLYATDAVPQYVVSATYQPGDMATYSNQPWVCVSAGTTGAWSQGRWARTTLYDQVALKKDLSAKADASELSSLRRYGDLSYEADLPGGKWTIDGVEVVGGCRSQGPLFIWGDSSGYSVHLNPTAGAVALFGPGAADIGNYVDAGNKNKNPLSGDVLLSGEVDGHEMVHSPDEVRDQIALKGELSAKQGAILDRIQALEESLGQIGSKLDQILE